MRQALSRSLITVAAAGGVLAMTGGYAHADAEARTNTSHSPGIASGNSVQVPVTVPVNLCGNSVDPVGLLNPSMGNGCGNTSAPSHEQHAQAAEQHAPTQQRHKPAPARHAAPPSAHAEAPVRHAASPPRHAAPPAGLRHDDATTAGSPGVGSGNNGRVQVETPVNACGNTADLVGLLNPVMGNDCGGDAPSNPAPPPVRHTPPPSPHVTPPVEHVTPPVAHPAPPVAHPAPPKHAAAVRPVLAQGAQLARTGSEDLGTAGAVSAGLLLSGAMLYRRSRTARV
ncbi:chaplin [Streptomyces sp. NPDC006733]|uniref:chaplin n=1 Tax=Streptomyces sp. NPDC006733 TaxID=3155460 RepID=UPI0033DB78E7